MTAGVRQQIRETPLEQSLMPDQKYIMFIVKISPVSDQHKR